jgi:hypothetical protein
LNNQTTLYDEGFSTNSPVAYSRQMHVAL